METGASAYDFSEYEGLELVDTTGAGDSFTGAYAVAILEGKSQKEALEFACQVAFLTVSKLGAGPSMPTREELHKTFPCEEKDISDCSYCALIRHAERADRSEVPTPSFRVKHDPPLTALGME